MTALAACRNRSALQSVFLETVLDALSNPDAGEHTIVSRVTDANRNVQPAQSELPEKVSRWENFGQMPRTLVIS